MCIGHGVAGQPPHVVPRRHHDPSKESNMQTSKAFRCTLPMLREDQVANLRRWADLHCAQSIVFRDDRGSAVFVGLKAELRTCASFSRTVRTALRRLCIDVPLRGRWCTLITPREALTICASDFASRGAALPPAATLARDSALPRRMQTTVMSASLRSAVEHAPAHGFLNTNPLTSIFNSALSSRYRPCSRPYRNETCNVPLTAHG